MPGGINRGSSSSSALPQSSSGEGGSASGSSAATTTTASTTSTTSIITVASSAATATTVRRRRIILRRSDLAKFLAFAGRFRARFPPDVMDLIGRRFAERLFLFNPQNALRLRGEMRWRSGGVYASASLQQQSHNDTSQAVLVDVEEEENGEEGVPPPVLIRIRDQTGYTHLSVNLRTALDPRRLHTLTHAWDLSPEDVQLPEDMPGGVVHCSFIRPFEGELSIHVRDQDRGACLEFRIADSERRLAWPPRVGHACMDC